MQACVVQLERLRPLPSRITQYRSKISLKTKQWQAQRRLVSSPLPAAVFFAEFIIIWICAYNTAEYHKEDF